MMISENPKITSLCNTFIKYFNINLYPPHSWSKFHHLLFFNKLWFFICFNGEVIYNLSQIQSISWTVLTNSTVYWDMADQADTTCQLSWLWWSNTLRSAVSRVFEEIFQVSRELRSVIYTEQWSYYRMAKKICWVTLAPQVRQARDSG